MLVIKTGPLLARRHVLRGCGVALALPFLDCMRPVQAAAARPRRRFFKE